MCCPCLVPHYRWRVYACWKLFLAIVLLFHFCNVTYWVPPLLCVSLFIPRASAHICAFCVYIAQLVRYCPPVRAMSSILHISVSGGCNAPIPFRSVFAASVPINSHRARYQFCCFPLNLHCRPSTSPILRALYFPNPGNTFISPVPETN